MTNMITASSDADEPLPTSGVDAHPLPRHPPDAGGRYARLIRTASVIPRDLALARKARRQGARHALRIVQEARNANLTISLAFALIEQESTFRHIYGHDDVRNRAPKGGRVTRSNYLSVYLPDRRAGLGMQGVGLGQLTWFELQDEADRLGGCWKPRINLRTSFHHLKGLIDAFGEREGIKRYNGSGPDAERYAREVLQRKIRWHNGLT